MKLTPFRSPALRGFSYYVGLGVSAVALLFFMGCAAPGAGGAKSAASSPKLGDAPRSLPAQFLEPGKISVVCPETHAQFSFDKAEGRIDSAAEGAGRAATFCLVTPSSGLAPLDVGVQAVGFAVSPFAAAGGAIMTRQRKLAPNQLSDCESNLTKSMTKLADPKVFRASFLKIAGEQCPGRFLSVDSTATQPATLELAVTDLRLQRTGSKDFSFALAIRGHARLFRTSDGSLIRELPLEYHSRPALFYDWTLRDAIENVAQTAYRGFAEQVVAQLFLAPPSEPVLIGVGFKPSRARVHQAAATSTTGSGIIGVFVTADLPYFTLQAPLTKEQAVAEAISDVQSSLDNLNNHPNVFVSLTATIPAVPASLWKQSAGGIRGVSAKKHHTAEKNLLTASRQLHPPEELAFCVAQQLTPRTTQKVVLLPSPVLPGSEVASITQALRKLGELPQTETISSPPDHESKITGLEIQIINADLEGKGRINPPLALCLEAKAKLVRPEDGQELHCVFARYRSRERSFTQWAANDAQLFRQELQESYRQLSEVVVNKLALPSKD